ncbi:MAG: hypothetical protein OXH88_05320 [Gammaproteobacteria bacterium]|nr:hypothetical protein [Gammaproteobacteria bacterium]
MIDNKAGQRAEAAVMAVLPHAAQVHRNSKDDRSVDLKINGIGINVKWLGEGGLRQARELIANRKNRPDVAVARRMSPGAREALSAAGIGWVDEMGAAEIALDSLIVSRSGRLPEIVDKPPHWTPSVLATAEALFCGKLATVEAIRQATGLSVGSSTNALHTLSGLGLLSSEARRGRDSARQIADPGRLLDEYAAAAASMMTTVRLAAGGVWRDLDEGLRKIDRLWKSAKITWAATGATAASVLAPYLTKVSVAEIYVDAATIAELESVAAKADLKPIEGGRVILRPFPTVATRKLMDEKNGLHHAPWPRVYADLRVSGVRGEDAAEHLRESVWEPVEVMNVEAIEVVEYECDDLSAEVTFNIFGKKYKREMVVTRGRTMSTRSHWLENKPKVIDRALKLLLNQHEELRRNPQVYKAIAKMQKTLSDSSNRLSAGQADPKAQDR